MTHQHLLWLKRQPWAIAEINGRGISVEQYIREKLPQDAEAVADREAL